MSHGITGLYSSIHWLHYILQSLQLYRVDILTIFFSSFFPLATARVDFPISSHVNRLRQMLVSARRSGCRALLLPWVPTSLNELSR